MLLECLTEALEALTGDAGFNARSVRHIKTKSYGNIQLTKSDKLNVCPKAVADTAGMRALRVALVKAIKDNLHPPSVVRAVKVPLPPAQS